MLQDFFGRVRKPPDKVTAQEVFVWAHGKGVSGKDPSPVTIGARMACLSSFFRFLIRMDIVQSNPCDKLERPRTSTPPARGLSAEEVRRLLAVIPDTPPGLRDRAIILTLVLTGRRRAEVFRMTAGDLSFENEVCFYAYAGKGGKTGRRELPRPALDALRAALAAYGRSLSTCPPTNRCGPLRPPRMGEGSEAPPFTDASAGIWRKPVCLPPACMSCVTGRQAPAGCRRMHRGRIPVPGPQLSRRDHHLPAPAGRPRGHGLGTRGGGDRALIGRLGSATEISTGVSLRSFPGVSRSC